MESANDPQSIGCGVASALLVVRGPEQGVNLGDGDLDSGVFHSPRLVES